jgi:hypothetical protein
MTGVRQEELFFSNGDVKLAGTLMLPDNEGPHPAMVTIHGSGQSHRGSGDYAYDEAYIRHFVSQGIATLFYDKRGNGNSSGDWRLYNDRPHSFPDLAQDAIEAVRLLRQRDDISPDQIGVWGISQAGWLGPMAAALTTEIAFVIALSAPGVTPSAQMNFYISNSLRREGCADNEIEEALEVRRRSAGLWRAFALTGEGWDEYEAIVESARDKPWLKWIVSPSDLEGDGLRANTESLIEIELQIPDPQDFDVDPKPILEQVHCPVLAVWGDADILVPVDKSVAVFEQSLKKAGNSDVTLTVLPKASHGLMVPTSKPTASMIDRFAPDLFDTITDWLLERVDVSR